ncbi:hypothetical protein [uncultured Anaerococcus sp.]|uniref:hypothetical protein n=1 Tax=uncultured Anaerococcus sp. TaxID=293428 RepID=UPI002889F803|nr:hypothetical protein [uncultured Anaerococcus sp.]
MTKIKGIKVILVEEVEEGRDPFNAPLLVEKEIEIENVLVSPTTSDDIINSTNLYGKKAAYVLGIPKGDNHDWENKKIKFFGQTFKSFGKVTQGIEAMIPLEWNKKVRVETYE